MRDFVAEAGVLRSLHRPGDPLVLPNVWDAASARAVAAAGFPVVATSSAAVADALGYADGEATPPGEMFDAVARISAAVRVPVTADVERGYRLPAPELVERLLAAGAVGCNLEDSIDGRQVPLDEQAAFLGAVRAAATRCGVPLVINARIDSFLIGGAIDPDDVAARAARYRDAGADCVYPILAPVPAVAALAAAVDAPVNALCAVGQPRAGLVAAGAARISYGAGLFRAVEGRHVELLNAL